MPTTPCWRRRKALEEQGYIKRHAAIVDRRKGDWMSAAMPASRWRGMRKAWPPASRRR
ncbi:hypothetical protein [Noviherbaspirillum soli]|uniref:hypothetical protein n=1 Tax=Noviherbaspirillum soli TaxID=1064518 RepID=UPI001E61E8F0|nr:hypothetical protein [Noviherbaspirillum soli]